MSKFTINDFHLSVGDVADIYTVTGGLGYAPISADIPTAINLINYKSEVNNKQAVDISQVAEYANGYFENEEQMLTAISNCSKFFDNVVWIFGGEYGGIGLVKVDNNTCNMYVFGGIQQVNNTLHPFMYAISALSYTTTIDNTGITQHAQEQIGSTIEGMTSAKTVNTGFVIVKVNTFTNNNIEYHDTYAIVFNPQCIQSYVVEPVLVSPTYVDIEWISSADNFVNNYMNKYTTILPDFITQVILQTFKTKRFEQFKLKYYPYAISYDLMDMWGGTTLFGGAPNQTESPTGQPTSTSGGGYPSNNKYSEPIDVPRVPTVDLINTGFVRLYNPSKGEVQSFANFLFSSITDSAVNTIKKMLVNPLDGIMSLHMIHTNVSTDSPTDITFCGVSSGVSANVVTSQYKEFQYAININEVYKSFLDYSNFTKMRIYIPYCGIYELNPDEFMNGELILDFKIDLISGMCVAIISTNRVQKSGITLKAPLYVYNGNCILTMPISASDWRNTFLSVIDIAGNAIIPSPAGAANIVNDIFSQKVTTQKCGSLSSNFGYLSNQVPYIIIERPEPSYPDDYTHWKGYPSNLYTKLSHIRFTDNESGMLLKVAKGDLWTSQINATEEEKEELKNLFDEGVWLRKVQ